MSSFAHIVNLVHCRRPNPTLVINKVQKIVKYIKRIVNPSDELRKRQTALDAKEGNINEVIFDVRTRLNANCDVKFLFNFFYSDLTLHKLGSYIT